MRRQIKNTKLPERLLQLLQEACDRKMMEGSVIGAAMQVCGYQRWWSTLMETEAMRKLTGIQSYPILRNIYLRALPRSAFGSKWGVRPDRQRQLVSLGKAVWDEVGGGASDSKHFDVGIAAALEV